MSTNPRNALNVAEAIRVYRRRRDRLAAALMDGDDTGLTHMKALEIANKALGPMPGTASQKKKYKGRSLDAITVED